MGGGGHRGEGGGVNEPVINVFCADMLVQGQAYSYS